jgi:hypothetical protein
MFTVVKTPSFQAFMFVYIVTDTAEIISEHCERFYASFMYKYIPDFCLRDTDWNGLMFMQFY